MNIAQLLSAEADESARRYDQLTDAWRKIYVSALDDSEFGSQALLDRCEQEAYAAAHSFLDLETELIGSIIALIASEARTATYRELSVNDSSDFSDSVSERLSDTERYLAHELAIQIERDIALLRQSLSLVFLQVSLAASAQNVPLRAALLQHKIGNVISTDFFVHDHIRKWTSKKHVRALWRHNLLSVYNETTLLLLAERGETTAAVAHLDAKAPANDCVIAMSAGSSQPTYAEIRGELFHPNSDAVVCRGGSDVFA